MGPELSPQTLRRIDILFSAENREAAKTLLYEQCGNNLPGLSQTNTNEMERLRVAALKYSDGDLSQLERAVKLAQRDYRDLLMAAGFGHDVHAHQTWEPKPAGEPAEIDVVALAATIHHRLAAILVPLGFERQGDEWRRGGELAQSLRLITGLTSRIETRFFLRVQLEGEPKVMLHLPKLPPMDEAREQGYIFRAGDDPQELASAVAGDVMRVAQPWFQRFTSPSEMQRGFEDGTFRRHLPVEGQAWIL
jgi:hypothetical protein